jgi:hypothetical protein
MDIKTERLRLIEKLMLLEDVRLIQKIKDLLSISESDYAGQLSKEELIARAEESNAAIKEGRVKSVVQVREEMKNWQ